MDPISRRHFLARSSAVALGFSGLQSALAQSSTGSLRRRLETSNEDRLGFGPLIQDPNGVIDLPEGFSYTIFSRVGERMDDGLRVPGLHDAMGAFPFIRDDGSLDEDRTVLVRNHEIEAAHRTTGAYDADDPFALIPREKYFDAGFGAPSRGGTTTLVYNTKTKTLEKQWMSLAGTERNCAGGITPSMTWLTCEETAATKSDKLEHDHGWVFEVPVTTAPKLADPRPIRAMGRFMHEACCTDPRTGFVYLTEDRHDGLLYRFRPEDPADLHAGGSLEVLRIDGVASMDTRNHAQQTVAVGQKLGVRWMPIDETDSPEDDLRYRGFERGAARFARGEGMWWGNDSVYFACTTGGRLRCGQIWRLIPDAGADPSGDVLKLFVEPNDETSLSHADNITFSPWGDIVVCEDESKPPHMLGITPDGELYRIARNASSYAEFAGASFSPDGSTLFVNIQSPGWTLAITGPWKQ
jgi:hypothetical protein